MSDTKIPVTGRIRILKRATPQKSDEPLHEHRSADAARVSAAKPERRDAATTVARWVDEMRERKEVEAKVAFGSLFQKAA